MNSKQKIKIGCIGAGYFARFHVDGWTRIPKVEVVAIVDSDVDKAIDMAREYGVAHTFSSIEELLKSQDVDIVDIITPPETHYELTETCTEHNLHIICQKPLAPSIEEAEAIVVFATQSNTRFMVHENFRFQPWYRKIKELLANQLIGENIYSAAFRMRMGDGWGADAYLNRQPYFRTMPRMLIYETGIHFVDVFRYLFGEIKSVFSDLRTLNSNIKGEDCGIVLFQFVDGIRVVLDANRYNESNESNARYTFGELLIEGDKGSIRLYQDGTISYQHLGQKETNVEYFHEDRNFSGDCVYATQKHFIECFINHRPFEHEGSEYIQNLKVQEAIYKSNSLQQVVQIT